MEFLNNSEAYVRMCPLIDMVEEAIPMMMLFLNRICSTTDMVKDYSKTDVVLEQDVFSHRNG
jgi:hypothetical protein